MTQDPIQQMLAQALKQAAPEEADVDLDEMVLPLDEGLQVTLESVPAGEWDESHTHVFPDDDAIVLHLVPPEAQRFDETVTEFAAEKDL